MASEKPPGTDIVGMEDAIAAAAAQLLDAATPDAPLVGVVLAGCVLGADGSVTWRVTSCADERLTTPVGRLYRDAATVIARRADEEGY